MTPMRNLLMPPTATRATGHHTTDGQFTLPVRTAATLTAHDALGTPERHGLIARTLTLASEDPHSPPNASTTTTAVVALLSSDPYRLAGPDMSRSHGPSARLHHTHGLGGIPDATQTPRPLGDDPVGERRGVQEGQQPIPPIHRRYETAGTVLQDHAAGSTDLRQGAQGQHEVSRNLDRVDHLSHPGGTVTREDHEIGSCHAKTADPGEGMVEGDVQATSLHPRQDR